jgi:integrase
MASITKLADGRHRARWRTPDGASRSATFDLERDAKKHLVDVEHKKLSGTYVDAAAGNVTVDDYLAEWESRQVHRVTTRQVHLTYRHRHISPYLGHRRLRDVRPGEIQAWVQQRSLVVGPSTLRNVYRVLNAMFTAAVADRLIATSPCVGVKLPKTPAVEVHPFEPEQVHAIADAIGERWRGLVIAGAALGMRQGELLGLTVDRVDFLRRTVRIDRQLITISGQEPFFGPVKTPQSVRTIPAPQVALDALAEHLATIGAGKDDLVFSGADGLPVRRRAIIHVWRRAAREVGMPDAVFHQLRHTCASLLIARGLSVVAVARFLGHSPGVCLKTYAHLWASDEERIRAAMDEGLSSVAVGSQELSPVFRVTGASQTNPATL